MKERQGLILLRYLVILDWERCVHVAMLHVWWLVGSSMYCAGLCVHPDLVAVKLAWLECLVPGPW